MLATGALITFVGSLLFLVNNVSGQQERSIDYDVRIWSRQPRTTTAASQLCDRLDRTELSRRLREADFNEFMADDVKSASRAFPDLGNERYTQDYQNYVCDVKCQQEADNIRRQMLKNDPTPAPQTAPPPTIYVPNNNWWHNGFWTSSRVEYFQPVIQPTFNRQKRQEPAHKVIDDTALRKNSGIAKGVIGRTIAIQCDRSIDDDSVPSNLYQFCKSCTAVRQLPEKFYPRILNEVICGEESCIKGNGKCLQRFLPFKVLQNFGTEECQMWRVVTINLRTCCDCMMDRNSAFMRYFQQD